MPHSLPDFEADTSNLHPQVRDCFWPLFHNKMRNLVRAELRWDTSDPLKTQKLTAEEVMKRISTIPVTGLQNYLNGASQNLSHDSWRQLAAHLDRTDELPALFFVVSQEASVEAAADYVAKEQEKLELRRDFGLYEMRRLVLSGQVFPEYTIQGIKDPKRDIADRLSDILGKLLSLWPRP